MIYYYTTVSADPGQVTRKGKKLLRHQYYKKQNYQVSCWKLYDPMTPRQQLAKADDILETCKSQNRDAIIISLYELPILRILKRIREGKLSADQFAVHCLDVNNKIHELRADNSGEFIDLWPEGFFNERMEELL